MVFLDTRSLKPEPMEGTQTGRSFGSYYEKHARQQHSILQIPKVPVDPNFRNFHRIEPTSSKLSMPKLGRQNFNKVCGLKALSRLSREVMRIIQLTNWIKFGESNNEHVWLFWVIHHHPYLLKLFQGVGHQPEYFCQNNLRFLEKSHVVK